MALDQFEVGVYKPGPGLIRRGGFEETVEEPESAWGEDASQLGQIIRLVLDAMKTAEVKSKFEGRGDVLHVGGIIGEDPGGDACFLKFSFGNAYSTGSEVEALHLPACICKCDKVGARAATNVKCATGRVGSHEVV